MCFLFRKNANSNFKFEKFAKKLITYFSVLWYMNCGTRLFGRRNNTFV